MNLKELEEQSNKNLTFGFFINGNVYIKVNVILFGFIFIPVKYLPSQII